MLSSSGATGSRDADDSLHYLRGNHFMTSQNVEEPVISRDLSDGWDLLG